MGVVVVGLDVGQRRDPTAIAVAEVGQRETARTSYGLTRPESVFTIRSLGRLPLGTGYPMVIHRVAEVMVKIKAIDPYNSPELVVDATGVGMPVFDELRRSLSDLCRVVPATFVAGGRFSYEDGGIKLGKGFLVSRLQALIQGERIRLPETEQAKALAKELTDYEIRVDESAKVTAGAFKTGTHDDLATALGLAVLQDKTPGRFVMFENDPDEVAALNGAIGVDCSTNLLDESATGF